MNREIHRVITVKRKKRDKASKIILEHRLLFTDVNQIACLTDPIAIVEQILPSKRERRIKAPKITK